MHRVFLVHSFYHCGVSSTWLYQLVVTATARLLMNAAATLSHPPLESAQPAFCLVRTQCRVRMQGMLGTSFSSVCVAFLPDLQAKCSCTVLLQSLRFLTHQPKVYQMLFHAACRGYILIDINIIDVCPWCSTDNLIV